MTQVSVVIPSRNAGPWLRGCLESLKRAVPPSSEVLVVDRASTDHSVSMVAREFGHVRLLRSPEDLGSAEACNRGFAMARGAYVLFLRPEVELQGDALRTMIGFLEEKLRHGAVVPRLVCNDGHTEPAHRGLPTRATAAWLGTPLARRYPESRELRRAFACGFDYEQDGDVEHTSSACLLMRHRALKHDVPFDPELAPHFDDADLCRRLRDTGWRVRYLADSVAIHRAGRSELAFPAMTPEWHAQRLQYYRKHFGPAAGWWVKTFVGWTVLDHFAHELHRRAKGLGEVPLAPVWQAYAGFLRR